MALGVLLPVRKAASYAQTLPRPLSWVLRSRKTKDLCKCGLMQRGPRGGDSWALGPSEYSRWGSHPVARNWAWAGHLPTPAPCRRRWLVALLQFPGILAQIKRPEARKASQPRPSARLPLQLQLPGPCVGAGAGRGRGFSERPPSPAPRPGSGSSSQDSVWVLGADRGRGFSGSAPSPPRPPAGKSELRGRRGGECRAGSAERSRDACSQARGESPEPRAAEPPALPAALASLCPGRESGRPHPAGSVQAVQSGRPVAGYKALVGATEAAGRRKRR